MSDDKKFEFLSDQGIALHHLSVKMPPLPEKYGMWTINVTLQVCSPADGFDRCPLRRFDFYSLSHLIDGQGKLELDGQTVDVLPGEVIIMTPDTPNRYGGAGGKPYIEDSVRFYGPLADTLRDCGIIRAGKFAANSERFLQKLNLMVQDPSPDAQIRANIELQKILFDLYWQNKLASPSTSPIETLLRQIKERPDYWWTVEELAGRCALSSDQLRRHFLRQTGMLPKQYIEEFKLRSAAAMLLSGHEPVSRIAGSLGYVDAYHFSRRFKLLFGISPQNYRCKFGDRRPY